MLFDESMVQTCRFIPMSAMKDLPNYTDFLEELSEDPPGNITWGGNNRSRVSVATLIEWFDEGYQADPIAFMAIETFLRSVPKDVYIDLEN
jgi:hypothetical protein